MKKGVGDAKKWKVWTASALFVVLLLLFSFRYVLFDSSLQNSLLGASSFSETSESRGVVEEKNTAVALHGQVMKGLLSDPYFASVDYLVSPQFSDRERSHLADVREVFYALRVASWIVLFSWLGVLASLRDKQLIKKSLRLGALGTLIVLLIAFVTPFSSLFSLAHAPFFSGDSWLFPSDSLLIQLYPQSFFAGLAWSMGVFLVIASVATVIIQYLLNGSGGGGTGG